MPKFIDQVIIQVQAGHGGSGAVSFYSEKYKEFGGPDGGDGGRGGDVLFSSKIAIETLDKYIPLKVYSAKAGSPGSGRNKMGSKGDDLLLKVPIGTQVFDATSDELLFDFVENDQNFVVAKGGIGGKGNAFFKSSINQTPRYAQEGEEGEERKIKLTLKLLADVGLVGLPNAGKSTLLSKLTHAHPKIASYAFTTLSPNLGVVKRHNSSVQYTVADIPGIIEGASKGVGLGLSFLKHIERVKVIVYLIDINSLDVLEDYKCLVQELDNYHEDLSRKPSVIVLNKVDTILDENYTNDIVALFGKKKAVIPISAEMNINLENVLLELDNLLSHD